MKVAVLTEPYFPKQKLSIKFNNVVLQHMELDQNNSRYNSNGLLQGQLFGIVQKMDKSYRSNAKYGTVCEIVGEQSTSVIMNSNSQSSHSGNMSVQAIGIYRFRIDKVVNRALDGLILTCEVTTFHEEGTEADLKLTESPTFQTMWTDAIEFCKLSQKSLVPHRQMIF